MFWIPPLPTIKLSGTKKLSLCINVAFFTWGSLVYPCKHLADRLELYIFTLKFFEWLILIKRKNLLEWFLFVSPCSSVFIFWCQINFGLMVWLYWFCVCVCVYFHRIKKSFLIFLCGKFHCFEIRLCMNASASRISFPFSHFFWRKRSMRILWYLNFYDV